MVRDCRPGKRNATSEDARRLWPAAAPSHTPLPMTERLDPSESGLARAAALLAAGRLVAFPTETVYGLGADATDGAAVARIFAAKDRPRFNPLILHLPDRSAAGGLVRFDEDSERLAAAFWPGPLTLVLARARGAAIAPLAGAGLSTLAVRVPDAPLARRLLELTGRPVAAPSANRSGRVSPTSAAHVLAGLGGRIDAVIDGGSCRVGVESTILATGAEGPRLLRPGGLPVEAIEACLGRPILTGPAPDDAQAPRAPGQLASHYAPRGRVRLNAPAPRPGEHFLGFGPGAGEPNLSPTGDLTEAAASLFDHLHALDAAGAARIAVAPIPRTGLGRAINDRLQRAAAPRD